MRTDFVLLQELDIYYLRNRVPIVEKSLQIILMKNTVNSTVKYIMLEFKSAVFYATIYSKI